MLSCFNFVREMSLAGVAVRLLMAAVCGGMIGIEREFKRRPAGFRTHTLICLGAAMAMLTNLYLYQVMHLFTDISRLGAQVIAGIGFIGAGTIIVTKRQHVKGLTTAAGLWTSGIIGLVCGAGYVECAIFATAMVLIAELLLIKLEHRLTRKLKEINLYIEYRHSVCIEAIIKLTKDMGVKMSGLEITRVSEEDGGHQYCAVLTLQASRKKLDEDFIKAMTAIDDVTNIEEL